MGPEGQGFTPPDAMEPIGQPETPVEPAAPETPQVPQRPRRGWWPFRRGNAEAEATQPEANQEDGQQNNEDRENVDDQQRAAEATEAIRNLERTPNSPQELQQFIENMDAVQWRERQLQEKYSKGWQGKWKRFKSGEYDFTMDAEGQVQHTGLNRIAEVGRKTLATLFNRKMAIATATTVAVGVFSGGIMLPAATALFGTAAGRGFVEGWRSIGGRERGLREEVARSQYQKWTELHEIAMDSGRDGITEEERNQNYTHLIDAFYDSSRVHEAETELGKDEKKWEKRRNWGMFIGGVAGGVLGAGMANLGKEMMRMDIDGNKTRHLVERVNGAWHYVYNTEKGAEYAQKLGAKVVLDSLGQQTHALGESTAAVVWGAAKNLMPLGAVFGGLWASKFSEGIGRGDQAENDQDRARREATESQFLKGQIPGNEAPASPDEGGAAPEPESPAPEVEAPVVQPEAPAEAAPQPAAAAAAQPEAQPKPEAGSEGQAGTNESDETERKQVEGRIGSMWARIREDFPDLQLPNILREQNDLDTLQRFAKGFRELFRAYNKDIRPRAEKVPDFEPRFKEYFENFK